VTDTEAMRPLVDRILERAALPCQREGAELFARTNALLPVERAPVAVCHELIPEEHWPLMLGEDPLQCKAADARALEWRLLKRLWAAEHIGDDRPLLPQVLVTASVTWTRGWGVNLDRESVGGATTASRPVPPFAEKVDVSRLTVPSWTMDEEATARQVERTLELTEGRLDVRIQHPTLGWNMFDIAVAMRGMDNLLMDCIAAPEDVHALMGFITNAHVAQHTERAARGWVNRVASPCGRYQVSDWAFYHCAWLDAARAAEEPVLADEWAYVSAQTSAGLGPSMYEEFVHPYSIQVGTLFPNGTVYYHGCECLDDKYPILASLPNLRRMHVSPWSSPRRAREALGRSVVLEVHAHPTRVFFTSDRKEMAADLRHLLAEAGDGPMDLNLNDIHSVNGQPEKLGLWAALAKEASAEAGPRG